MDAQPAPKGVKVLFGSDWSKFASVNNPERISGDAKNTATSGLSCSDRLSHLLKTIYFPGVLRYFWFFIHSKTNSGVLMYLSPSISFSIPHDRKYSKFGRMRSAKPSDRFAPPHLSESEEKARDFPFLTFCNSQIIQLHLSAVGTISTFTGSSV